MHEHTAPLLSVIPLADIVVQDRLRSDVGDLSDFDTIPEVGLIQPIVLTVDADGTIRLVAGGRRYAALTQHGYEAVHHGVTSDPKRPGFVFAQELPEDVQVELEITENVSRSPMTWQDRCRGVARLHELRKRKSRLNGENWVVTQTGALLGVRHGVVVYAVQVAQAMASGDEAVLKSDSMKDAIKVLLNRKKNEAEKLKEQFRKAAQETAKAERATRREAVKAAESGEAKPHVLPTPARDVHEARKQAAAAQATEAYDDACHILTQCDSLRVGMPDMPEHSVDHVYTDIPYGIDMDNIEIANIETTSAEHDRDSNIADFELFLRGAYRIVRPEGFCVFWFDIEHFTTLLHIAQRVGWSAQRWPLHWHKSLAKNEVPRFNTTKNYESVMVLRKTNAVLQHPVSTSIFTGGWDREERAKCTHPFANPFEAHDKMLKMFTRPGQHVCDPYCGEGSGVLAMLRLDLQVTAFELSSDHIRRAREHIVELLCTQ